MRDETEGARRALQAILNTGAGPRADLEARYGQVWDTSELIRDFEVIGFAAPCVVVKRRSDGKKGTLFFQHSPRLYWGFE
jgi:hypothetical protein